jgi:hypothetical protein
LKINLVALIVAGCCTPTTAFAYIDPGSGMLIWQGLIAAVGAVLLFIRKPWDSVKKLVARLRRK